MLTVLKTLVREGHLSDEQFEQLAELEDPDLHTIKEVITDTKVGEGLKFLPRTITNLRHTLQSLLTELEESGNAFIKSKITAISWKNYCVEMQFKLGDTPQAKFLDCHPP